MEDRLDALAREATLLAAALGESAVDTANPSEVGLGPTDAATLIYRLNLPVDTRALLFNADGTLAVDSWRLPMAPVQTTELPPPEEGRGVFGRAADAAYDWITARLPPRTTVPLYIEPLNPQAADFPKVLSALQGTAGTRHAQNARRSAGGRCVRADSAVPPDSGRPVVGGGCERRAGKRSQRPLHHPPGVQHRARDHHPPQPLFRRHDHPPGAPAGAGGRAGARWRRDARWRSPTSRRATTRSGGSPVRCAT